MLWFKLKKFRNGNGRNYTYEKLGTTPAFEKLYAAVTEASMLLFLLHDQQAIYIIRQISECTTESSSQAIIKVNSCHNNTSEWSKFDDRSGFARLRIYIYICQNQFFTHTWITSLEPTYVEWKIKISYILEVPSLKFKELHLSWHFNHNGDLI